jgi:hypothetical protein
MTYQLDLVAYEREGDSLVYSLPVSRSPAEVIGVLGLSPDAELSDAYPISVEQCHLLRLILPDEPLPSALELFIESTQL